MYTGLATVDKNKALYSFVFVVNLGPGSRSESFHTHSSTLLIANELLNREHSRATMRGAHAVITAAAMRAKELTAGTPGTRLTQRNGHVFTVFFVILLLLECERVRVCVSVWCGFKTRA